MSSKNRSDSPDAAFRAALDAAFECPKTGPEYGVWIRTIGGACPCQADGTLDGCPFYFRARHGTWTLTISRPGSDPVDPSSEDEICFFKGADDQNGYMSQETAADIIFQTWLVHRHDIKKKRSEKA